MHQVKQEVKQKVEGSQRLKELEGLLVQNHVLMSESKEFQMAYQAMNQLCEKQRYASVCKQREGLEDVCAKVGEATEQMNKIRHVGEQLLHQVVQARGESQIEEQIMQVCDEVIQIDVLSQPANQEEEEH
jgi:hypothetical protein